MGVLEKPEDDLETVEEARMHGTCEWFSAKKSYQKWKDFAQDAPSVLWISGKPTAGKSVLAGYAVNDLGKTNTNCSWFFFKHGDKSKSRLSACLRSLAFQMACKDADIREKLLEMENGINIDDDSEGMICQKLSVSGIFQVKFRHYWVIDALDDCVNFSLFFDSILSKLGPSIPLRILITSRETYTLEKPFLDLGANRFRSERISAADTLPDMKLLVQSKTKSLFVVRDDEDHVALVGNILEKSRGSFLWTNYVLQELPTCYSEEDMKEVLDEIPPSMKSMYHRMLGLIPHTACERELAKAVLMWVTCAARSLTAPELEGALQSYIKNIPSKPRDNLVDLCGQLVTVDESDKIELLHETTGKFLLGDDLESEFAVNEVAAHTQISRACLMYLTGQEMNPPQNTKRGSVAKRKRAAFSHYACLELSYHLTKADPLAADLLVLIDGFLRSNVLSWIEVVALTQNLNPLTTTAMSFRAYLNSCVTDLPPHDERIQVIRGWATDLTRIATEFADALLTSPSAIYSIVLPFCPSKSMAFKIQNPLGELSVDGLSNAQWDDRLACINFSHGEPSAVGYGDELFAVGLSTGTISLYHATSYQKYKVLDHGESVTILRFASKTYLMASYGLETLLVWNVDSDQKIHGFQFQCIGLVFDKNILIAASHKNYLASWDLDNDGARLPDRPWKDSFEDDSPPLAAQPCAISISVSHEMLAVAYPEQSITLWDIRDDVYCGSCGKRLATSETSAHSIQALVFNPNPEISLIAVSYSGIELVLLDPFNDQELRRVPSDCYVLAASSDGHLLGSAGAEVIQIHAFDTLELLYQVKPSDAYTVEQLAFSMDSLHLADIRGSQCNVWDSDISPQVFNESREETPSDAVEKASPDGNNDRISTMVLHPEGEFMFCGKGDGSVSLCDLNNGALQTLYNHDSPIRILTYWPQNGFIMSIDDSNNILAKSLKPEKKGWVVGELHFQSRLICRSSVIQSLLGESVGRFILSTQGSDHFWSTDGHQMDERMSDIAENRTWVQHPHSPCHIICIQTTAARVYTWNDWSEVISVSLGTNITGTKLKSVTDISGYKHGLLLEFSEPSGSAHTRGLHLFEASSSSVETHIDKETTQAGEKEDAISIREKGEETEPAQPLAFVQKLGILARHVIHIIGMSDSKLIFIDVRSWVCSINLESKDNNNTISYSRHFFVPHDWFSAIGTVICAVSQQNIVFALNGEVAVIKGGLEYAGNVNIEVGTNSTSSSLPTQEQKRLQN